MRLYTFGKFPETTDPKPLDAASQAFWDWMHGKEVAWSPELNAKLHSEFLAQAKVRVRALQALNALVAEMKARAMRHVDKEENPLSPAEQYRRGYEQGLYYAYSEAAIEIHARLKSLVGDLSE